MNIERSFDRDTITLFFSCFKAKCTDELFLDFYCFLRVFPVPEVRKDKRRKFRYSRKISLWHPRFLQMTLINQVPHPKFEERVCFFLFFMTLDVSVFKDDRTTLAHHCINREASVISWFLPRHEIAITRGESKKYYSMIVSFAWEKHSRNVLQHFWWPSRTIMLQCNCE